MRRRSGLRWAGVIGVLVALALVAAACGGDDGDGGNENAGPTTTEDPNAEQKIRENQATGADNRTREGEQPATGGRLVYGLEADTANPWVHYASSCAISCYMVLNTISESLFVPDEEGKSQPYLLESSEASADYKTWTWTVRDGITFHDGTPLDGAAVKYNMDTCRASPLTGAYIAHIADTQASGQTVTITLKVPDVAFDTLFTIGQCAYMFSPTWMATLESNPLRKLSPEAAAVPATGNQSAPVGMGPFKFESYTPGNGNSFIATKNPDYWRAAEGLPYLDEVELVAAVDVQSRTNGLRAGQFNIVHTANSDEGVKLKEEGDWALLQANAFGETSHVMLNVAQGQNPLYAQLTGQDGTMDPEGKNAGSPLLNVSCRRALAYATDLPRFVEEREAGVTQPANGPFPPGSIGYLADSGFPLEQDVDRANQEMDTCLAELGTDSIEFSFNTTNDPFNVESNQLTISMWQEVFGSKVKTSVTPIEQGQYIGVALVGAFNAFAWRNFGATDPDQLYHWWISATSSPIGKSALNFGRFIDPEIDKQLTILRSNPDPAARQAAAEAVNRRFASEVYNLWYYWTLWTVAANPNVRNLTGLTFPETDTLSVPVIAGRHFMAQVWCEGGNCGG